MSAETAPLFIAWLRSSAEILVDVESVHGVDEPQVGVHPRRPGPMLQADPAAVAKRLAMGLEVDAILSRHSQTAQFLADQLRCGSPGRSARALIVAAVTDTDPADQPSDFGDLASCLDAYLRAPLHLQLRMERTLIAWLRMVATRREEQIGRDGDAS